MATETNKRPGRPRATKPEFTEGPQDFEKEIADRDERIRQLEVEAEGYRLNAQAAYEQNAMIREEMDKMRSFFTRSLAFCNEQTVAFAKTIALATKGDI